MDELDFFSGCAESGSKCLQIISSPLILLLALKLNGTLLYLNAFLIVSNFKPDNSTCLQPDLEGGFHSSQLEINSPK